MPSLPQYIGQAAVFAAVAAGIGFLSALPVYHQVPDDMAQIKLSFRHGGRRVEDCRKLTPEEIAKLPPQERRPNTCDRERLPVAVRIDVDGQTLYEEVLHPTGLSNDGPSETYRKFLVTAGPHTVSAYLRDSGREEGYDFERSVDIDFQPHQSLAVDFKADQGGFLFR
jgi:hypothetical protein